MFSDRIMLRRLLESVAAGPPERGRHGLAPDPSAARPEAELRPGLAQQVPVTRQEDRRHLQDHLPRHLRHLQHLVLELLPDAGGKEQRVANGSVRQLPFAGLRLLRNKEMFPKIQVVTVSAHYRHLR